MTTTFSHTATGDKVLDFYKQLAFNRHSTIKHQIKDIKRHNPVESYPVLPLTASILILMPSILASRWRKKWG